MPTALPDRRSLQGPKLFTPGAITGPVSTSGTLDDALATFNRIAAVARSAAYRRIPSTAYGIQRKYPDVPTAVGGFVADPPLDSSNPVEQQVRQAVYWRPPSSTYMVQRRYGDVSIAVSGYVTDSPLDVAAAPGSTLWRQSKSEIGKHTSELQSR